MNLLAVQYDIAWEDKAANCATVARLLRAAAQPGDLAVLPEMFATGFSMNVAGIDEGTDRPTERFLAELAAELKITLVGGVVHADPDGRGKNQAVVYSPAGQLVTRYSKIHPFTFGQEADHYTGGDSISSFALDGVTIAPFVCYDLRFPEIFRHATARGSQVLLVIANWPAARQAHWLTLLQARAIENQSYVVGVNRIGSDPNVSYAGRSIIIDPRGEILADAGDRETVIRAPFDPAALQAYRQQFPALRDLHPAFLGLSYKPGRA